MAALASPALADVTLLRDGRAVATIVTPASPNAAVRYAADELASHVERATGAKLPIVAEGPANGPKAEGARVYLGDTQAAQAAGLRASALAAEAFVLRSDDRANALFIVGRDEYGDPLDRDTSAGTLFGVYEWLERELGVRWLSPGDVGTVVPRTRDIALRAVDATVQPRFFQRYVRPGLGFTSGNPALGFTSKAAADYAKVQTVVLRRQRMGRSEKMTCGHAFTDWWEKYGKDHPEWFQLVKGKRGPEKPGARYSMCVSNPELRRQIIALCFVARRRETIERQYEDNTSRWRAFAVAAQVAFPAESFTRAAAILADAERHAHADRDEATRAGAATRVPFALRSTRRAASGQGRRLAARRGAGAALDRRLCRRCRPGSRSSADLTM